MKTWNRNIFYILFILFFSESIMASFDINEVSVVCEDSIVCQRFKKSFGRLAGVYESKEHFQSIIKEYLQDVGYESLNFTLSGENSKQKLTLQIKPKKLVKQVVVFLNGLKDTINLTDILLTKVETYLNEDFINNDLLQLRNKLSQLGYSNASSEYEIEDLRKDEIKVIFKAKFQGTNNIVQSTYACNNKFIKRILKNNFDIYQGRPYVRDFIQQELSILKKILLEQGYYQLDVTLDTKINTKGVLLNFDCKNEHQITIQFNDADQYLRWENIYTEVRALLTKIDKQFLVKELTQYFEKKYESIGRKATVKIVELAEAIDPVDLKFKYSINVTSGVRTKLKEILFRGNSSLSHAELEKLYYKNASDLAKNNYVDENYYKQFIEILKKEYYYQGLLTCNSFYLLRDENKVSNHVDIIPQEAHPATYPVKTLIFDINEGVRSFISEFKVKGLEQNPEYEIVKNEVFAMQGGTPFNPIRFENDLNIFLQRLKDEGHFDAHYIDDNEPLVRYERSAQQVFISINIYLGPKYKIGNLYIVGLDKTKESILTRKIRLKRGADLTTQVLESIQSHLANLALFKTYEVKVLDFVNDGSYRDIIVHVEEKDFGALELTPGYRTDLGLRLAGKLIYNNLFGQNHSASVETEVNNRLSHTNLDPSRSSNLGSMLEYQVKFNYTIPDIFKSYWDFNTSLSSARRRLYSFDAEIQRFTNTFTHDFTSALNFSLRQQLEIISQFNAVQTINEGDFRIGSLTPSVTFDKRNNTAYATKGYLLNLSYELAKPEFLSSESNGYEIDFYRLITRNRFYVPFSSDFGMAFSITMGMQENLKNDPLLDSLGNQQRDADGIALKKGFIPSIKVFRLSGIDTVRGFSEEEINRLPSGKDITTVLIQDRVYLTNFKVEPRYKWSDQIVLGAFWDAGKIQVDDFDMTDVRSSVGLSFKYLTPVGTLDLDYGMKLLRKQYPDGTIESPGRIHISIGFF